MPSIEIFICKASQDYCYTSRLIKDCSLSRSQSPFPRPMAHRAAPISVAIALAHASANAVKATAGSWSTGSSASLTFPLHSHMSSARREGSDYHFSSLWYNSAGARTHDLPVEADALPLGHHSGYSSLKLYLIMKTYNSIFYTYFK